MEVAVIWAWSRRRSHHVVERLILELIITAVRTYYSILLFLLFRVVAGSGGGEGVMIEEEHHWCEFQILGGRLVERILWPHLSAGCGSEAIGRRCHRLAKRYTFTRGEPA